MLRRWHLQRLQQHSILLRQRISYSHRYADRVPDSILQMQQEDYHLKSENLQVPPHMPVAAFFRHMAQEAVLSAGKKTVHKNADTICLWCFLKQILPDYMF